MWSADDGVGDLSGYTSINAVRIIERTVYLEKGMHSILVDLVPEVRVP